MPSGDQSFFTFKVAGVPFALPVTAVQEVLPTVQLHVIPEAPALLAGFLEIAEELIPVIHLHLLLRLAESASEWPAIQDLSAHVAVIRTTRGPIAWAIDARGSVIHGSPRDRVRLPPGHSLNECAEWVIPRPPPEPSIVVLDPERVLLEKEQAFLTSARARMQERLAAVKWAGE